MSGKSPGPWKASLQTSRNTDESSYPGLKPAGPDAPLKTQYTETQEEEIEVLSSIYQTDFVEHKAKNTAWQRSEPSFDIRIRAPADEEFAVTLGVVLTATYPRSPPLLSIKDEGNLGGATLLRIQALIKSKPKTLVASGEPMIHDIALGIEDILEDAASAKAQGHTMPSLEEERTAHEAELARRAELQRAEEDRKQKEATEEEERMQQHLLEEQLKRQRAQQKESRKKTKSHSMATHTSEDGNTPDSPKLQFDQTCRITDSAGNDAFFTTVTGRTEYRKGLVAITYTVRPILMNNAESPMLVLKEFELRSNPKEHGQFKKHLVSIERKLNIVKKLDHRNLLELLDFRIDRDPRDTDVSSQSRIVRVLMPWADKGPLDELLEVSGNIAIAKVRSWTIDLLAALGFLHSNGLCHEDIHPGNILLFREGSGQVVPKLADATYQRELHSICRKSRTISTLNSARSTYWIPPELANSAGPANYKTDIWDFGVVFLQMLFGLDIYEKYQSPQALVDTLAVSSSLEELLLKFFKADPAQRTRALDLRSSEFLVTEAPTLVEDRLVGLPPSPGLASMPPTFRKRLDSSSLAPRPSLSRYKNDFYEEGRLGKGGFGEVVKVRKKIDGQIYAIKKITQLAGKSLTATLKEVLTLSQLSHPAIVRYYDAWIEQVPVDPGAVVVGSSTETETETAGAVDETDTKDDGGDVQLALSTGGLDFMSSTNLDIQFGYDEDEEDDEDEADDDDEDDDDEDSEDEVDDDEDDEDEDRGSDLESTKEDSSAARDLQPLSPRRSRNQQPYKNVLYILMEYCEKKTLRDLIKQDLYKDPREVWRLFREILDGLVHIHGLNNVVHRDLKPENIFIARAADDTTHVKIGDFGLATSGHVTIVNGAPGQPDANEVSNVGTASYLAPELEKTGSLEDARKLDMYALGIILFEMCYKPMLLGHERWNVLRHLRDKNPSFPEDFKPGDTVQTETIMSLVTHSPKDRPSSSELLRNGKLPIVEASEGIQRALAELALPGSQHHEKMLTALFSQPVDKAKDSAWDMVARNPTASELAYQGFVKDEFVAIFRRHGAVEITRSPLYPRSTHYSQGVVELMNRSGSLVQLPHDLMLGHARALAKHSGSSFVAKSFTFGSIFRDNQDGAQPQMLGEVDFDIVSADTLDLALKEAEVIKVLDEILLAFPSAKQMCLYLGHSDLLQLIFDFCDVELSARRHVAEILSKLNTNDNTWQKIRGELRAAGLSVTSIDELQHFDFRDLPQKAFTQLKGLFEGSDVNDKSQSTLAHLKEVIAFTKRFNVRTKIYVCPLSSLRENFFRGGVLFQCVADKKFKEVLAAGGRYDSLIREHRPKVGSQAIQRHAVGFSLAWEKLAKLPKSGGKAFLKKTEQENNGITNAKRCDVLVASFTNSILRTTGVEVLQALWSYDVSAELARDARSPEELLASLRSTDESYSWIVMVKPDGSLKIKSVGRSDVPDVDVSMTSLLSWVRTEMRDRHQSTRQMDGSGNASANDVKAANGANPKQDVKVLVGGTKPKKFNRRLVVEQAQASAAVLLHGFSDGPIVAIEASDIVLDSINETRLSDVETWRKAEQSVSTMERKYMREIQEVLSEWRNTWQTQNGSRHAFVYNSRTSKCIYYDLSG